MLEKGICDIIILGRNPFELALHSVIRWKASTTVGGQRVKNLDEINLEYERQRYL